LFGYFGLSVLSIGKIALGQHRYYEQQVAQGRDDYYSGRGEAPGEWIGPGARALGLSGCVSAQQFGALLAGYEPRDPAVRLRSSDRDPKVAALDLTFSAPKSVSVLAAVGADELTAELIGAHEEALGAALVYLNDTAVHVRRGHDGHEVHKGEGVIAAAYRHRMSRALDPQLHTHVVAANMTRGPDGRYTALHGAPLYRAAKTAGYLYQSHLRALISECLGLEWGPVRKGAAELSEVPCAVLEEFSKRRHEMLREALAGGIGIGSKAAAERAAIATRDRKRYGVDTHTWREEVRARASELELGTDEVARLVHDGRERLTGGRVERESVDERTLGDHLVGADGLTDRANTFDERAVLQEFATSAGAGAQVAEVRAQAERFGARADVIRTSRDEMTTTELVECERRLIGAAAGRAAEGSGLVDARLAERAIAGRERSFTDEQAAAVRATVSSGQGVTVIEALAGTGKTYMAGAFGSVYESAGYEVIGVAPTGRAARELSEQAEIESRTLDRLLVEIEQPGCELPRGCVIIFDEAGMAPTRLSARLLQAAELARAKVIAIGDPGQLASVQAGGWLGAVGRALGAVRLTEVFRQRDLGERRALAALHEGLPRRYLEWAERAGRIQTVSEPFDARERAVGEWLQATQEVGLAQAVMIARDNDTRAELNYAARELVGALGLLGEECSYGGLSLALGDRVICRRNDHLLDLDNGTRGMVRYLDEGGVVIETDSRLIRALPANYVSEHVEHAYAMTGHGMQGATVEAAIVLASPRDLTAGWSYTALSRARGTTRLLIHDTRTAPERSDLAPDARHAADRHELLQRVERRMLERDAEDLAIEQLPLAGHADDPQLTLAEQTLADPVQEQSAASRELKTRPPSRRALAELEESLERLHSQRRALPSHKLKQLEDAEARTGRLTSERDRLLQKLRALPEPSPRRLLSIRRDPDELDRSRLVAAISAYDGDLERALAHRARLERELGDPEQVRPERAGLDRAIEEVNGRSARMRERLDEREGEIPSRHDAILRDRGDEVERSATYDLDLGS
jgi:conjugative relaxase-like TrwC/TraI family protein